MGRLLTITGLERRYQSADGGFRLLVPELEIAEGETLVVMGESGSGKSTLLDMLALLAPPTACRRFLFGESGGMVDLGAAWAAGHRGRLAALRAAAMGYVLQTGGLLPSLSVGENILLSRRLLGLAGAGPVPELAARLGIGALMARRPEQLSIGQRQRVAVVRALAHQPGLVLADEPTAALDPARAAGLAGLLAGVAAEIGAALVVVCHDPVIAARIGGRLLHCRPLADGSDTGSVVEG
ncbi:MAG: ABC transporter ATP-binding protein [Rhodospirillaceae bacterium]